MKSAHFKIILERLMLSKLEPSKILGLSAEFLLLLAIITSPNIYAHEQARIIGGVTAVKGDHPWVVALVADESTDQLADRQFCGGTVINERWVITAAHCVYDAAGEIIDPSSIKIATGVHDLIIDQSIDGGVVTNIFPHPLYNPVAQNEFSDIALLETANEMKVRPIEIYSGNTNDLLGKEATVLGWGVIDNSNPNMPIISTKLQEVNVPIVPLSYCNLSYDGILELGHLCAGYIDGGKDACQGDSGGPLFMKIDDVSRLVGIVSSGDGCAETLNFGIYTNTSRYLNWIQAYTNSNIDSMTPDKPYTLRGDNIDNNGAASPAWMLVLGILIYIRKKYA